jgi:hypothetical protein
VPHLAMVFTKDWTGSRISSRTLTVNFRVDSVTIIKLIKEKVWLINYLS